MRGYRLNRGRVGCVGVGLAYGLEKRTGVGLRRAVGLSPMYRSPTAVRNPTAVALAFRRAPLTSAKLDTSVKFVKILVANRGEIACRVFRTAAAMGHQSVAVFTPPTAVHCTPAVRTSRSPSIRTWIPPRFCARPNASAPMPSTRVTDSVGEPDFAQAVSDAGLIWIGPTAASIRAMALKVEAKGWRTEPACRN